MWEPPFLLYMHRLLTIVVIFCVTHFEQIWWKLEHDF